MSGRSGRRGKRTSACKRVRADDCDGVDSFLKRCARARVCAKTAGAAAGAAAKRALTLALTLTRALTLALGLREQFCDLRVRAGSVRTRAAPRPRCP